MEENEQVSETSIYNNDLKKRAPITNEELSSLKTIGGLGALFAAGAIIPYVGSVLSLASIVLFLIAFHKISKMSGQKSIFVNIGMSYLIGIVLGIAIVGFFIFSFFDFMKDFNFYDIHDYDFLEYYLLDFKENFFTVIMMIVVFFLVISVACAYLWKMSLDKTAEFFNDKSFKTAGILMIIGASTLILCGVGILVNLAAYIVLAVAFFNLSPPNTEN